jgi:hypothetical protein
MSVQRKRKHPVYEASGKKEYLETTKQASYPMACNKINATIFQDLIPIYTQFNYYWKWKHYILLVTAQVKFSITTKEVKVKSKAIL